MAKRRNEPRAKRRGWLKNGNPPGDPSTAPRCGAKTRKGTPCQAPAMKNGRCRMHGGKSTGPRTPEGLDRSRKAALKHGFYSEETMALRRSARALLRRTVKLIAGAESMATTSISREEIQVLWSRMMADESIPIRYRLRASELLGRSMGDFAVGRRRVKPEPIFNVQIVKYDEIAEKGQIEKK